MRSLSKLALEVKSELLITGSSSVTSPHRTRIGHWAIDGEIPRAHLSEVLAQIWVWIPARHPAAILTISRRLPRRPAKQVIPRSDALASP
ncbi:hypothetical protein ACFV19_30455 [Streptomyces griseoluteus]|uniref:hypothetical protein n=1 Tax=Streptomyces griseoluteus TaxID=29306 RepID=UPI00369655EC